MEKNPKTLADLPEEDAYVILTRKAVRLAGDISASTDRPGEVGTVPRTEHFYNIQAFNNEMEWDARLTELLQEGTPFKAFLLKPVKVTIKADIQKDIEE